MIRLGLTGSIGMGKTTTAKMFKALGIPVFDADQTVHTLYDGPAVPAISAAFPGVVVDGRVDRMALSAIVLKDAQALKELEALIHPLVRRSRSLHHRCRVKPCRSGHSAAVRDGGRQSYGCDLRRDSGCSNQRQRVLAATGYDRGTLRGDPGRQWPDRKKRAAAHFLVDTGFGMDSAKRQVSAIIRALRFTV